MHGKFFAAISMAMLPVAASAAWQLVTTEQGKRLELDRDSIVAEAGGKKAMATGRLVLDKPIVDPKTSASYRIIEIQNRFDCTERTYATIKRTYFKEEGTLLRQDEIGSPLVMPVRTGSPDDRLLREVCRPKNTGAAAASSTSASKTVEKVNEVTAELRKVNEALIEKEVKKDLQRLAPPVVSHEAKPAPVSVVAKPRSAPRPAVAHERSAQAHAHIHWGYEGAGGPENWGKLSAEYASCGNGKRQSPIDIRDGIRVDLEPIQFDYRPAKFRVVDNGHTVQVSLAGGGISLLGKGYQLIQFHFHQPSEEWVNGKPFDMVAHLVHKSDDGKLAVVAVLFEKGSENALVQTVWNNLPLEKNEEVAPPALTLDLGQLLPENRSYYTYMGSLTTPPCSEGVLWLVLKQPQQISPEQLAIFARLYPNNVRPVQPRSDRLIKESR